MNELRLRIEADGGSRGNPGPAGSGSAVFEPYTGGEELANHSEFLAHATNNFAEYLGLINGLKLAREVARRTGTELSALTVDVFMDSKLVVEQMSGRWKIKKEDLKPLAAEARALAADLKLVTFTWVPRAQNKRADELANRAMDSRAEQEWFRDSTVQETQQESQPKDTKIPDWHHGCTPTRFILLRHGQTPMSAAGQYSGRSNPALTELGEAQAAGAAAFLSAYSREDLPGQGKEEISAVLASPLQRTQQTAEAVASVLGLPVTTEDGLIEMDFGTWEGKTFAQVRSEHLEEHEQCFFDATRAPEGGESQEVVFQRVSDIVDALVKEFSGRTIVLVSHVVPIKSVLRKALGCDGAIFRSLHLDLASTSIVDFYADGSGVVRLINGTHYLSGGQQR